VAQPAKQLMWFRKWAYQQGILSKLCNWCVKEMKQELIGVVLIQYIEQYE
jgi:hypothetical protein